ncbi:hypothetical protein EKH55_3869 [Sinorhizobium alkalisoli]|nr:hypothetical protein EKH55_3869 [Sinorhizobium alkalisoli]
MFFLGLLRSSAEREHRQGEYKGREEEAARFRFTKGTH